jgi:hypothetical protein
MLTQKSNQWPVNCNNSDNRIYSILFKLSDRVHFDQTVNMFADRLCLPGNDYWWKKKYINVYSNYRFIAILTPSFFFSRRCASQTILIILFIHMCRWRNSTFAYIHTHGIPSNWAWDKCTHVSFFSIFHLKMISKESVRYTYMQSS